MIDPIQHMEKAQRSLQSGHLLLANGFHDEAGRSAYLAAFHAAQAFTVRRTGKEPKTHSGLRSEFARLARDEPRIERRYVAFLARAFELKTWADYGGDDPVSQDEAADALAVAAEVVQAIKSVLQD
ncbi:MAG TPA: HEPN domain-containing protein [Acetobacteraceae bacterium]|nr:HEPN domain-containing protein [Acetobacteraceae bacterium]